MNSQTLEALCQDLVDQSGSVQKLIGHLPMADQRSTDQWPDVRDGLTRKERIVLACLHELQTARKGRNVPTAMLYGRVVEHVDMSVEELQGILQRFIGIQ